MEDIFIELNNIKSHALNVLLMMLVNEGWFILSLSLQISPLSLYIISSHNDNGG